MDTLLADYYDGWHKMHPEAKRALRSAWEQEFNDRNLAQRCKRCGYGDPGPAAGMCTRCGAILKVDDQRKQAEDHHRSWLSWLTGG